MYRFSYSEVVADDPAESRSGEREVIEQSIVMLEAAERAGAGSREAIEAIYFVNRLWSYLIESLSRPDNDLPPDVKARLISIGLFLIREADSMRTKQPGKSFQGLIDISRTIAEGLK